MVVPHGGRASVGRSMGAKWALTGAQQWAMTVHDGCYWCHKKPCSYSTCSENLWSGRRESNPRSQLGKQGHIHSRIE
jgi:hypothetical protein